MRFISLNYVDVRHVSVECDPLTFGSVKKKHISKKTYIELMSTFIRVLVDDGKEPVDDHQLRLS